MNAPSRLLLLDLDEVTAAALRDALAAESSIVIEAPPAVDDPSAFVHRNPPHLLLVREERLQRGEHSLARRLHVRPGRPLVMAIVPAAAADASAAHTGADLSLAWPAASAAIREHVLAALRLGHAEEQLELEREQHRKTRDEILGQIQRLLGDLLDIGVPGALERGERTAELALGLAARFEIPSELLPDLDIAARLHGLGRLVTRAESDGSSPVGTEAWGMAVACRQILLRVEGLAGAAEVVGSMCENWDGTGLPEHRLQGQIPLRSRILRASIDYLSALDRLHRSPADTVVQLMEHKGARYDPLVLVHLETLVTGTDPVARRSDSHVIPIDSLEAGMILADDLYTTSGIKLLARGTRLGLSAIESILRRHRAEPIHHGVTVRRTGT